MFCQFELIFFFFFSCLQSLQTEIENHEPRINSVIAVGRELIDEQHPQSDEFKVLINDLSSKWKALNDSVEARKVRLLLSDTAQQVSKQLILTFSLFHFSLFKIDFKLYCTF